jgi:hypothetical protein
MTRNDGGLGAAPLLLLAAVLGATGCGGRTPPLAHTHPNARALAAAVLDALHSQDASRLRDLALDEREFRDQVWRELPAARPERNVPFSYAWGELRLKSAHALNARLAEHGGRAYELLRVEHGETTKYDTFVVHRDNVLIVRTADGVEQPLHLYGSTIEKGGTFKVFSYVTD